MISFIKNKLRQRLFGGDVARLVAAGRIPDPEVSLKRIQNLGFTPKVIFDVGAYQGDFSKMCLDIWRETSIHAFEALPAKMNELGKKFQGKNVKLVSTLVGEEVKNDVLFYADENASSILASQEFTPKKRLKLPMTTLDEYVVKNHLPAPDFLKIDTQGYEYPILKGFEQHLNSVKLILLELNTLEVYNHATLAHNVIAFLNKFGFVIYDICEIHRRPLDGALFQMDFLFVKEDSIYRKDKRWSDETKL